MVDRHISNGTPKNPLKKNIPINQLVNETVYAWSAPWRHRMPAKSPSKCVQAACHVLLFPQIVCCQLSDCVDQTFGIVCAFPRLVFRPEAIAWWLWVLNIRRFHEFSVWTTRHETQKQKRIRNFAPHIYDGASLMPSWTLRLRTEKKRN